MAELKMSEELKTLLDEHRDLALREFDRVFAELVRLRREVRTLRKVIARGEQSEFPWFTLPTPRRRQVEAVVAALKDHPDRELYTLPRVCRDAFFAIRDGYPNAEALAAYCYRIRIELYL